MFLINVQCKLCVNSVFNYVYIDLKKNTNNIFYNFPVNSYNLINFYIFKIFPYKFPIFYLDKKLSRENVPYNCI